MSCLRFFTLFFLLSFLWILLFIFKYIYSIRTSRMSLLVVHDYLLFSVLFFKKIDVIFYPPSFFLLRKVIEIHFFSFFYFLTNDTSIHTFYCVLFVIIRYDLVYIKANKIDVSFYIYIYVYVKRKKNIETEKKKTGMTFC